MNTRKPASETISTANAASALVEVGAQQIADRLIKSPVLGEALTLIGGATLDLRPVDKPRITQDSPPGKLLWSALGFESVSMDIEGADICLDLNEGRVPPDCRAAFDLISPLPPPPQSSPPSEPAQ